MKLFALFVLSITVTFGQTVDELNDKGLKLMEAGKYAQALPLFEQLVKENPGYTVFVYNRAIALFNLKRFQEALADYKELAEAVPDESEYVFQAGNIYEQLDAPALALTHYDKAIAIDGDQFIYYFKRGTLYLKMKKWHEAISDFNHVITINASHTNSRHNLAIALYKVGRENEACEQWCLAQAEGHTLAKGHFENNCKSYLKNCTPAK